jgi:uncharacterized phiE125 gp8 family phage protein
MPYHIVKPPTSSLTGATVSGSAFATVGSTSALYVGQPVAGPGIPDGASILTVDSPTRVTLSVVATASGTAVLAFGQEPVSLAEAKKHLEIELTDFDDEIAGLIRVAREDREAHLERSFLTTSWELILDAFPLTAGSIFFYHGRPCSLERDWTSNAIIELRKPPIQSVGDIIYLDTLGVERTLVSGVDFTARTLGLRTAPTRIFPATHQRWPATLPELHSVRIPFVAGYGNTADTVPECIKLSMKMIIKDKFENRSATTDVANNAGEVPLSIDRICAPENWGARV